MKHLDYLRAIAYNYPQNVDEFILIKYFINKRVFITHFMNVKPWGNFGSFQQYHSVSFLNLVIILNTVLIIS